MLCACGDHDSIAAMSRAVENDHDADDDDDDLGRSASPLHVVVAVDRNAALVVQHSGMCMCINLFTFKWVNLLGARAQLAHSTQLSSSTRQSSARALCGGKASEHREQLSFSIMNGKVGKNSLACGVIGVFFFVRRILYILLLVLAAGGW